MKQNRERIAELYFLSGSAKFGQFPLSVHKDNPGLPLSPYYFHYPLAGEPGSEHLPELFDLIGQEFYDLAEAQPTPLRPQRLAAVPNGATPLAYALGSHYPTFPGNLLTFRKVSQPEQTIIEGPVAGESNPGEELLVIDDHTSGGRNKLLMLRAARGAELVVRHMLTVVDREQGATATLQAEDVALHSLFTAVELLSAGVEMGFATVQQLEEVKSYQAANQYNLGPSA